MFYWRGLLFGALLSSLVGCACSGRVTFPSVEESQSYESSEEHPGFSTVRKFFKHDTSMTLWVSRTSINLRIINSYDVQLTLIDTYFEVIQSGNSYKIGFLELEDYFRESGEVEIKMIQVIDPRVTGEYIDSTYASYMWVISVDFPDEAPQEFQLKLPGFRVGDQLVEDLVFSYSETTKYLSSCTAW